MKNLTDEQLKARLAAVEREIQCLDDQIGEYRAEEDQIYRELIKRRGCDCYALGINCSGHPLDRKK